MSNAAASTSPLRDVSPEWRIGEVRDTELTTYLLRRFGGSQSGERVIGYPDLDAPRIQLEFDRHHVLTRAEASLDQVEIDEVSRFVSGVLLVSGAPRYWRQIMFAQLPVVGSWSGADVTLSEPPSGADLPPWVVGDHPFLVEHQFIGSGNDDVDRDRGVASGNELALLLEVFVPHVRAMSRHVPQHWAFNMSSTDVKESGELRNQWVQTGYNLPGLMPLADVPMAAGASPIMMVPAIDYYASQAVDVEGRLELPQYLGGYLYLSAALAPADRTQLLRAAYWLHHAVSVYSLSRSASLVAAVQAIEVLTPTSGPTTTCECCGRETGPGPTASFQAFLQQYAPANDTAATKAHKELYKVRSKLTHGNDLLLSDGEFMAMFSNPGASRQYFQVADAHNVARISIINWMIQKAQPPEDSN